ncbi:hypothetical protein ACP70R_043571 [Stipagrostis hirtigluma subsp. patula]
MTTSGFRGGLTGLRLRRLISFLRRNRLYATAHALERQTGVFFDVAHLRRMLLADRCAAASSYALSFVTVGDCSPEADVLNARILILSVLADFAAGQAHAVDGLFQRLYANLHVYKDYCEGIRKVLLTMRSDSTKASILYRRIKPKAVEVIMDLVAKCPEIQAKARLPRCTLDPAYIVPLRPGGLWEYRSHHKNKIGRIPARVLARSFLRKRHPHISHRTNSSGVPSAPVLHGMKYSRYHEDPHPGNSKGACASGK